MTIAEVIVIIGVVIVAILLSTKKYGLAIIATIIVGTGIYARIHNQYAEKVNYSLFKKNTGDGIFKVTNHPLDRKLYTNDDKHNFSGKIGLPLEVISPETAPAHFVPTSSEIIQSVFGEVTSKVEQTFTPAPKKASWQLTVENNDERNPSIIESTVNITDEVIQLTQKCGVRYDLTRQETIACPPEFGGNSQITINNGYLGTWSKGTLTGEIALVATNEDGTHFEGYWWNSNSNKEKNRFSHRVILELK